MGAVAAALLDRSRLHQPAPSRPGNKPRPRPSTAKTARPPEFAAQQARPPGNRPVTRQQFSARASPSHNNGMPITGAA